MFLEKFFNRYVRHGLTVISGYLIAKGIDAEVVNQTAEAVASLGGATVTALTALAFSYISDKVKF